MGKGGSGNFKLLLGILAGVLLGIFLREQLPNIFSIDVLSNTLMSLVG